MEKNIIYNDDCVNAKNYIDEKSVDLIFFSPPYANLRNYGHADSFAGPDDYLKWFLPKASVCYDLLKDTGSMIIVINDCVIKRYRHLYVYELVLELNRQIGFNLFERMFWDKSKSPPNSTRFRDTTEYIFWFVKSRDFKFNINATRVPYSEKTKKRIKSQYHTWHTRDSDLEKCPECKKQMKVVRDQIICGECGYRDHRKTKTLELNPLGSISSTLIQMGSEAGNPGFHNAVYPQRLTDFFVPIATDENDLVLDPMCGTGTTMRTCLLKNRDYIGFEISDNNYKEACSKIESYKDQLRNGDKAEERTANLF